MVVWIDVARRVYKAEGITDNILLCTSMYPKYKQARDADLPWKIWDNHRMVQSRKQQYS